MIRGILSGAAFGLVTVTVGLSVASLLAPQPAGNTPPLAPQVDAPSEATGDNGEGTAPDLAAEGSEAGLETAETPLVPAPEDAPDAVLADTEPAALPETGLPEADLTAPDDPVMGDVPAVAAGADAPVLPGNQSVAPQVPAAEDDLALSTDPAIPTPVPEAEVMPEAEAMPVAEVGPEPVVELPEEPAATDTAVAQLETPAETVTEEPVPEAPATLPVETEAPPPSDVAVEPQPELAQDALEAEPAPEPAPVVVPPADGVVPSEADSGEAATAEATVVPEEASPVSPEASVPEPAEAEAALPEPAIPEATGAEPVEQPASEPEVVDPLPAEPEVAETTEPVVPEPEAAEPDESEPALPAVNALGSDAVALPETDSTVRINRPGAEEEAVPEGPLTDDTTMAEAEVNLIPEPQGPALERYAAAFDNPEGKPLMAVILIDDGLLAGASIALGSLPFPVTVALDPGAEGATERMANYRAAGIEVMAIARLPQGARPADVMVTFESVFATLPDVVGVLDTGDGGLQANSAVAEQAMMRFATDGRGVVTLDEGLNMATRAAAAAGVPSGLVYRDLDGEGQNVQVIRRFLDQAAFRARQDSGVILLGRVRADTLSALNLWGGQNRAGQVALAPVSAVLLAQK